MSLVGAVPAGRQTMSSGLHEAENYHRWVFEWIAPYLGRDILDIGGGTGNHLQQIRSPSLVSLDIDGAVVSELRARFADRRGWSFELGDISASELPPVLRGRSFDTVLSSNVFEHIQDDEAAFRNSAALLRPGGRLVLVLPAHALLFGSMDRLAGHFRRYSRESVRQRLSAVGLEEKVVRYVNSLGAVGWFVNNRVLSHRDLSSPSVNGQIGLFDRCCVPLLRVLERGRSLPFGQSLLVVAEKPTT